MIKMYRKGNIKLEINKEENLVLINQILFVFNFNTSLQKYIMTSWNLFQECKVGSVLQTLNTTYQINLRNALSLWHVPACASLLSPREGPCRGLGPLCSWATPSLSVSPAETLFSHVVPSQVPEIRTQVAHVGLCSGRLSQRG